MVWNCYIWVYAVTKRGVLFSSWAVCWTHISLQTKTVAKVPGASEATGFSEDMATPHTTRPQNGTEMPLINPNHRYEPLEGVDPKFLRNMCFTKKHNKKILRKMKANNAKTMNACAKAVHSLAKPKVSKGGICLCYLFTLFIEWWAA